MKRLVRRGAALLIVLLCMVWAAAPAFAYTAVDTGRKASLTLRYGPESSPVSGAAFQLYRVAEVSAQVEYTLTGEFAAYPVSLEQLDSAGWRAAAETLAAYAKRDQRTVLRSGTTDAAGGLSFAELDTGLYLLTGDSRRIGRYTYTPEPMLVLLPGLDGEDRWVYDLTVTPKYESSYRPGGDGGEDPKPSTVRRRALKVWREDEADERPSQIGVQLLRNGQVYDTATLSEENGWSYTWEGLDRDATWQVTETEVPEGYRVSVSREGITFVITNTGTGETPPPTTPPGGEEPGNPEDPRYLLWDGDLPLGFRGSGMLPQTGMLWWPVPLLAGCGLVLFLIGWLRRTNGEQDHEE